MDDHALAHRLADRAGAQLLALRERPDVLDVGAAGDRSSHEYITGQLAAARPHDAMLSEEGADDQARLTADRVWIVDPLDGTREYGEPGRTDWAVHIALWERGELVAGAVGLPAQGRVLSTAAPPTVPPGPDSPPGHPIGIAVSRSRPPSLVIRLAELVDGQLISLGSAGGRGAARGRGDWGGDAP